MARVRSKGSSDYEAPYSHTLTKHWVKRIGFDGLGNPILSYFDEVYNSDSTQVASTLQTISDVIGSPRSYNPVTHVKRIPIQKPAEQRSISSPWPDPDPGRTQRLIGIDFSTPGYETSVERIYNSASMFQAPAGAPVIDWDGMVSAVGSNLEGLMTNKVQMLVTLAEVGKTIGMLKNPFAAFRSLFKSKRTLSSLSRAGGSTWLEYRYGWSQLYRDVRNLANMYDKVRSHMRYLAEAAGKERNVSNKDVWTVEPNTEKGGGTGHAYQNWYLFSKYRRTCAFSVRHVLSNSVRNITQLEHWMQGLGATQVTEALWDLIPFSFVVDWFFHINRLLNKPPDWGNAQIVNMGYSTKEEWWHRVRGRPLDMLWDGTVFDFSAYSPEQLVKTSYTRVPGFPPGTDMIGAFGNLSKTQMADGIALILQRL